MAAPSPSQRTTPTGFKMPDGYQALVSFGAQPTIQLWEKVVKPPGIDGKEAIDTTTMHNINWRTYAHRHLMTLTESQFTAAYDPDAYNDMLRAINRDDTITFHYPDGSSLAFYGFMQKLDFAELKEGEFPELTCTITPTNWDVQNGVEAAPTFTAASGT